MTKKQDYEVLVNMIDNTQKQISTEPKDKLHLVAELELLQKDLAQFRSRNKSFTKKKGVRL